MSAWKWRNISCVKTVTNHLVVSFLFCLLLSFRVLYKAFKCLSRFKYYKLKLLEKATPLKNLNDIESITDLIWNSSLEKKIFSQPRTQKEGDMES